MNIIENTSDYDNNPNYDRVKNKENINEIYFSRKQSWISQDKFVANELFPFNEPKGPSDTKSNITQIK